MDAGEWDQLVARLQDELASGEAAAADAQLSELTGSPDRLSSDQLATALALRSQAQRRLGNGRPASWLTNESQMVAAVHCEELPNDVFQTALDDAIKSVDPIRIKQLLSNDGSWADSPEALIGRAYAALGEHSYQQALDHASAAFGVARTAGAAMQCVRALYSRAVILESLNGATQAVADTLDQALWFAESTDTLAPQLVVGRGTMAVQAGDLARAHEMIELAHSLTSDDAAAFDLAQLEVLVQLCEGQTHHAQKRLEGMGDDANRMAAPQDLGYQRVLETLAAFQTAEYQSAQRSAASALSIAVDTADEVLLREATIIASLVGCTVEVNAARGTQPAETVAATAKAIERGEPDAMRRRAQELARCGFVNWSLYVRLAAARLDGDNDPALAKEAEDLGFNFVAKEAMQLGAGCSRFDLTVRETEVIDLIADGKANKEIARELDVSPRTVTTHVSNILKKLDAPTRGAAAAAWRNSV